MKRLFSGGRSATASPQQSETRSRSNSNTLQPPAYSSMAGSPTSSGFSDDANISPELAPIVTLLSAQAHRRYHEGVFMLLQSINSDGEPVPNRQWREVYGVLLGTQLAVWNVEELEKHQNDTDALLNASSKPDYINFTDSSFRAVERLDSSNGLKNVIVVSTTLKNQFLLQYPDLEDFHKWNAAFRLATFEYTSLQEAYTGALLSARGSKLSDIRTILAETKFDHEDWVSVRFGSGMPWKRCYAVIEQPKKKRGSLNKGSVSFYKDEKKQKKTAMAIIKDAQAAYGLYPNSVKMIDHSTMIKLEGTVFFDSNKKSLPKEASVYFMPEQHNAVPGYDTIIRFLVPLLNAFVLYGRPKRLNANKTEKNSLLFGLPVLPHVHYLEVDDLILLSSNVSSSNWLVNEWRDKIKDVLARKLASGYSGCGSSHGIIGAINSPAISSNEFLAQKSDKSASGTNLPISPLSPSFFPVPKLRDSTMSKSSSSLNLGSNGGSTDDLNLNMSPPTAANRNSQISQIYEDYSNVAKMAENGFQSQPDAFKSRQTAPKGAGIGFSNGLDDPYVPQKQGVPVSPTRSSEPMRTAPSAPPHSQPSVPHITVSQSPRITDPYVTYKQQADEPELDEDFESDEIFQKGISAMNIEDKRVSSTPDLFTPDYVGKNAVAQEPALKYQTASKTLPEPASVKKEMAYTSGRIMSPVEPLVDRDAQFASATYHNNYNTVDSRPPAQQQPKQSSIPRSDFQRFSPPSAQQKQSHGSPQRQAQPMGPRQPPQQTGAPYSADPYRQAPPLQQAQPPRQTQAPGAYPVSQPAAPQQNQKYRVPPPQQQQSVPQQPYRAGQHVSPPQQSRVQQPPVQERPPVQQQVYQPQQQVAPQQSYPPQQGYPAHQRPVQQQAPHPQQQAGYPPQQQQRRQPPPQQQGYAAPPQQHQSQLPQHRPHHHQPQQYGYSPQQQYQQSPSQQQYQAPGGYHQPPQQPYQQRKPAPPSNPGSFVSQSNPYAQGNPYSK